ncbi:hypothetical protein HFO61_30345 [Rhizobium leguminosarum]|uniref:hypothetical protein n=1 Tax=Rhizobium leguminosarum TaxID=384 RepID=UPI001C97CED3|nr:hypothetical protein [Rhizobium leguminosarum]MBY5551048.1 hypothetical protein [Rhizobium leguminosarum]
MLRMNFANIDDSFYRSLIAYDEAKAALIAEAGAAEIDFIQISGNVFMSLVLSHQPLFEANCYYLKQGWKLADNFGLSTFTGVDRPLTRSDAYCDFIEAAFSSAIIRAIREDYQYPAKRKDKHLRLAWERYGFHDAPAEQIAA